MALRLRDSRTGEIRAVRPPPSRSEVTLYVCGPTVYDSAHVGHARTFLYFDVARRALEARGRRVRHVMNITDFEDKITDRARSLGTSWRSLARTVEREFWRDLGRLRVRRPTDTPRASAYVPAMIAVLRRLEKVVPLERREGGWYFPASARPRGANFDLGRAQDLSVHDAGTPQGPSRDFLAWKPQEPPHPSWPSPWGRGAPGWHLECFAMAERLLGVPVDLHGGGTDLLYPHHAAENEIANALVGGPFARVFLHTGFVVSGGRKMAKSVGNLVTLQDALDSAGPDAVRLFLLSRPWSESLAWSDRGLAQARETARAVRAAVAGALAPGAGGGLRIGDLARLHARVESAVEGGLDVGRALEEVEAYGRGVGRTASARFPRGERGEARRLVRRVEDLLGVSLAPTRDARPGSG